MAIKVKQYTKNNILEEETKKITFPRKVKQIGVQSSLSGLQFKFNNDLGWISIGLTGIYELENEELIEIKSIQFKYDDDSSKKIFDNADLILIDIIYEE